MLRVFGLVGIALLAACGGGGGDTTTGPGPTPPGGVDPQTRGSLIVNIAGLPAGQAGEVLVTGPNGFSRMLTTSATLTDLPAGQYTITTRTVRPVDGALAGTVSVQTVEVAGGAPPVVTSVVYTVAPAVVGVEVSGLPGGSNADITLTSPAGATQAVTASQRVTGISGGWTLAARAVRANGFTYTATPATDGAAVLAGDSIGFRVQHTLSTGAIAVLVSGLPAGNDVEFTVTGPNGFSQVRTNTATLTDLAPGVYTVTAPAITIAGALYKPSAVSQQVTVSASLVAAPVTIAYAPKTATLVLDIDGAPNGATDYVRVTGPGGYQRLVSESMSINDLLPGVYTVTSDDIVQTVATWRAAAQTATATLVGDETDTVTVRYAVSTGSIAVLISGLPGGSGAVVSVTGPSGFARVVTNTATLLRLTPGTYTVTAGNVSAGANSYGPTPASQNVEVEASLIGTPATVAYRLRQASLHVNVSGTGSSVAEVVRVTGPNGFDRSLSASASYEALTPGQYTITAAEITSPSMILRAGTATTTRTLTLDSRDTVDVAYAPATGLAVVSVTGLPGGASANMQLTGPNGFLAPVAGNNTFVRLAPGNYTLTASPVSPGGTLYSPNPTTQTIAVAASYTAAMANVSYASGSSTGVLVVTVAGVPAGASPSVVVTGPSGYTRTISTGTTITSLAAGGYTVTPGTFSHGGSGYSPSAPSVSRTLTQGGRDSVGVVYTADTPPPLTGDDLSVEFAYVTQAIQRPDGTLPLVAGRDALVRVFVKTSRANSLRPDVRLRVYDGATLLQTVTIAAPESSVRGALVEGSLATTWNTIIPAANVRTALRILADVDPASTVATDSNRTNNTWPRGGTPQSVTVIAVKPFNLRFVPVTIAGVTGNVSEANMSQFLRESRLMMPLGTINADVRLPFTSSAAVLQAGDENGAWLTVLSELNALRGMDGAPASMHYYGVVKVGYTSGVAGFGYVPGKAAMGWDYLPSGDDVAAHEFGHNFSRPHSPCGVPGDSEYPHAAGSIGYYGWNSTTNALVAPTATDFMGYCNNTWTSDWTWSRIMTYRQSATFVASANVQGDDLAAGEGLLVWGRIVNGRVMLEPAFRVQAAPTPAVSSAAFHVEAIDAGGTVLMDLPIEAPLVDHVKSHVERQFAVVLPWSARLERSLATLRVRDVRMPLSAASRSSDALAARQAPPEPAARVERAAGRERLQWNSSAFPMAMVRDVATGQTIAFLRHSGDDFAARGRTVDIVLSDGVRSVTRRVSAGGQPQ
ncbi:MAG: hypothetical protein V4617_09410 [Gemmatimonadota bacterium]